MSPVIGIALFCLAVVAAMVWWIWVIEHRSPHRYDGEAEAD